MIWLFKIYRYICFHKLTFVATSRHKDEIEDIKHQVSTKILELKKRIIKVEIEKISFSHFENKWGCTRQQEIKSLSTLSRYLKYYFYLSQTIFDVLPTYNYYLIL